MNLIKNNFDYNMSRIVGKKIQQPFLPKQYERPGLEEDEILEIKEAFDLFDPEKTGYISPKELKDTMDSLGFDDRSKIIYEMLD